MILLTWLLIFQPRVTLLPGGVPTQNILASASNDLTSLSIQIPVHNCLEPLRSEHLEATVECMQAPGRDRVGAQKGHISEQLLASVRTQEPAYQGPLSICKY